MQPFFTSFALTLGYGLIHSVLAATQFKQIMRLLMGPRGYEGLYRLFFNVVAVLLLLPIVWIIVFTPGETVWRVYFPLNIVFLGIQMLGGIGLLVSILQIDGGRFLGLTQSMTWLEGRKLPLPTESLTTGGVYALMRHPLYLFSLMLIWPVTTMTAAWLGFSIGATIYFLLGSLLEEQKLRQAFGASYEHYQRQVPWFLPTGWFQKTEHSSTSPSDQS